LNQHQVLSDSLGVERRQLCGDAAGDTVEGGYPDLALLAVELVEIADVELGLFLFIILWRRLAGHDPGQNYSLAREEAGAAEAGNTKAGNAKTGAAKAGALLNAQGIGTDGAGAVGGGNDPINSVRLHREHNAGVGITAAVVILR